MTMVTNIVEYRVKPAHRADFEAKLRAHAAGTLREEEGCLRFDVMVPRDEPNRLWLFELYRDQAALDTHAAGARLKAFRDYYAPLLEDRRIVVADVLPADVPPKA